jgi:glucose/arabinose dehydrogenase
MIPVAEGLLSPEGLAVDLDGSLLVVETGAARLARISLVTGEVTTVADGLSLSDEVCPAAPPTWIFSDVAVGPSGAICATGDVQNVLYRLRPAH